MKRRFLLISSFIGLTMLCKAQTVTDIDGNVYNTVTIGTQTWMQENLKTSRYCNGDIIPNVTDSLVWPGLSSGAWCYYDNNASYNVDYGKLYNWYAVHDSRGLCPAGWHVPSDTEWTVLADFLGGDSIAGGKMKETGTAHWIANIGATNESGFNGLPGGYRLYANGLFSLVGYRGYFWSSTEYSTPLAWARNLEFGGTYVYNINYNEHYGYSIRCIKDNTTDIHKKPSFLSDNILIYLNPANNYIRIENLHHNKKEIIISIYNIQGQILIHKLLQQRKIEIDISNYSAGIYILKINSNGSYLTKKLFIKE